MKKFLGLALVLALCGVGRASASTIALGGTLTAEFGLDSYINLSIPANRPVNADAARNDFLAKIVNAGTETFEGQRRTGPASYINPLPLSFVGNGMTGGLKDFPDLGSSSTCDPSTDGDQCGYVTNVAAVGRQNTTVGGQNFYLADNGVEFEILLSRPVSAFGFYSTDVNSNGAALVVRLFNGLNLVSPTIQISPSSQNGSIMFLGFIDTALTFDRVFLGNSLSRNGTDTFGFDDFTVGDVAAVPEPTSIVLLGTGVVAAIAARRRRSKKSVE